MDFDQWMDKQSGAKRSRMKVVAENVQFLRIRRPEEEALEEAPASASLSASEKPPTRRPRRAALGVAEA